MKRKIILKISKRKKDNMQNTLKKDKNQINLKRKKDKTKKGRKKGLREELCQERLCVGEKLINLQNIYFFFIM